jgi:3-oxoacyl-[acyl-carrier protein] reductase
LDATTPASLHRIIVNNAGYWDNVIKMSDEQFQAMLDIRLVAPFRILRAASTDSRNPARGSRRAARDAQSSNIALDFGRWTASRAGRLRAGKAGVTGLTKVLAKNGALQRQRDAAVCVIETA